ncbi:MAG: type II secretion system F family protein [Actinomycetota bacterium]
MISQHLQIPTLIFVAPVLAWGVWLLSESSFDSWGSWQISRVNIWKIAQPESARKARSQTIFLNFSIGVSITFLTYFIIFINSRFAAPMIAFSVALYALFTYANDQPKRAQKEEQATFEEELPTHMQLMTVLISSGVSPSRAMDLLSRRSQSISGQRLREVVADIHSGRSVVEALDGFSQKYDSLILRRFATGIILAIERGSSLTPILIAQVRDARVARKNHIMQKAGRAEISLMIPVVFLILPVSILFALWPSYQQLGQFI